MFRIRKYIYFIYLIIDIFLIAISFYLSYYLTYKPKIYPFGFSYFKEYIFLFTLWGMSLIFLLKNYQLYQTERRLTIPKEIARVTKVVFFSAVLAGLFIFLLQLKFFSRFLFISANLLLTFNLSLWRILKRILLRNKIKQGFYNINVLIIGAGKTGLALVEEIEKNPYLGLRIVGFLDDYKIDTPLKNYKILGKITDLTEIAKRYFVDRIFITIPSERKKVSWILDLCKNLKISAWIIPEHFSFDIINDGLSKEKIFHFSNIRLDFLGKIPLLCYIDERVHGSESLIKRIIDILVSGIGLILFFPLFLIIGFLIKLDSPGPVFYRSIRCGKKGRPFIFYKFRSMYKDADKLKENLRHLSEVKGPVFKIKRDPRVTRMGRILRRYSLDELPQLINVLKGDMSLVGPRPPTPDEVEKYETWQLKRLEVKPGITGLWQVRGRSDLSFYKWVKWDIWYIDNWSLGLDLLILLWTIPAVLKKKGAY